MTVAIVAPMWGRHKLTLLAQRQWARAIEETRADAVRVLVGSEGDASRAIAEQAGAEYVECANVLSDKLNAGVMHVAGMRVDAVIITGSDDLCSTLALAKLLEVEAKEATLVGYLDFFRYFDAEPSLLYWPGYPTDRRLETVGVGRLYSRQLLNRLDWAPWEPGLPRNCDGSATARTWPHLDRYVGLRMGWADAITGVHYRTLTTWSPEIRSQCTARPIAWLRSVYPAVADELLSGGWREAEPPPRV